MIICSPTISIFSHQHARIEMLFGPPVPDLIAMFKPLDSGSSTWYHCSSAFIHFLRGGIIIMLGVSQCGGVPMEIVGKKPTQRSYPKQRKGGEN